MKFPPSFIERLKSHFLLSDVIGRRIAIKKAGREYHALCPFHNEKSPSFTINDEKSFYHCFGCSAHGDVITFLMAYEKLTYPETIERLARDAGIELPAVSPMETQRAEREKTVLDVLDAACSWFEGQLGAPQSGRAREYVQKRGLKPETVARFRIGYAPDERTALYQYLTKAGFPQSLQAEAGLIIQPEGGNAPYDRFRGRVMFPIRNPSGKVVAFGGRLIVESTGDRPLPKYLNSPETTVFKKGEMLYNLDLARRPARDGNMAVVMEGYMDVVSTAQSGVNYAVATLGTAVTPEHLRLLWQLCNEPVMCLDGDTAGKRAMIRAAEVALPLLKPGYSLRFAVLPKGEDPDTYIQKHGKASFEKILHSSRRLSQVLWDILASQPQHKLDLPEGKAALEAACQKTANAIGDETVKQHYISYFRKQMWGQQSFSPRPTRNQAQNNNNNPRAIQATERSPHVAQMVVQHHSAALDTLVRRMLHLLMSFPPLLHKNHVEDTLSSLDIRNHSHDGLRNALLSSLHEQGLDEKEALVAYIQTQMPGFGLASLTGETLTMPYKQDLSIEDAWKLWNETVSIYRIEHMRLELDELNDRMGQHMDEANYQRWMELKQAIVQAEAARAAENAEPDIT